MSRTRMTLVWVGSIALSAAACRAEADPAGVTPLPRFEAGQRYHKPADETLRRVLSPLQSGLRYCINSAALRFIPKERLVAEGYGKVLSLFD